MEDKDILKKLEEIDRKYREDMELLDQIIDNEKPKPKVYKSLGEWVYDCFIFGVVIGVSFYVMWGVLKEFFEMV